MRYRVGALVLTMAIGGVSCSSDDGSESAVPAPTGPGAPAVEAGTLTITVETADGTSPITVADRLDQVLAGYPGARRASVDDTTVVAVVSDFPRVEVDTFEFTMQSEPIVTIRPVIECLADGDEPPALPEGAELLSGEATGQCVLGPSPFDSSPFTDALALPTLDRQVSLNLDPELLDEFNALATACYESAPSCPTQQLAIVANGEIITAPVVNVPDFPEILAITGDFTEEGAIEFARLIIDDRFTGEFVSVSYEYEADT